MRQIELSAKSELISVYVKKIAWKKATLETLDREFEFTLSLALLPENLKIGEQLNLKISDVANTEDIRDDSARKLLEEIIN